MTIGILKGGTVAKLQAGQIMDLLTLSMAEAKVGDFKYSAFTPTDFMNEHLGQWMLCNGQTCMGTVYHTVTGKTNVPDAVTEGTFLRQAKAGRVLLSSEEDAIRNISGKVLNFVNNRSQAESGSQTGAFYGAGAVAYNASSTSGSGATNYPDEIYFDASRQVPTADENRPKNIALNLYVKVGY